jgi:hypothetical protein
LCARLLPFGTSEAWSLVDASGVTLGGSPGRYRSTTCLIPWSDIKEIVL